MVVSAVYCALVFGQVGRRARGGRSAYQRPMIIAAIAMIVLTIMGAIGTAIGTAIAGAVTAEITGEGSATDDIDRSDERDALSSADVAISCGLLTFSRPH